MTRPVIKLRSSGPLANTLQISKTAAKVFYFIISFNTMLKSRNHNIWILNINNVIFKLNLMSFIHCQLLSLRVFGLLSSSVLLFQQGFGRYIFRPSWGVCRTREPSRNFELRPLLNPQGSPVLIPLAKAWYKCSVFLYCYSPAVRIEPATSRWLSPEKLDNSGRIFGTYKLKVLTLTRITTIM